ncbi:MAG: hypothetical protein IT431_17160 [Phycisphaerales bacterium]|nr:hypothetical protein [Phycisphaerales bacterium]
MDLAGVRASHLIATIVGAAFAAAVIGGATIVSAHGGNDSSAAVHLCASRITGALRAVHAEGRCFANLETPLHVSGTTGFYRVTVPNPPSAATVAFCDEGDEVSGGGFASPGGAVVAQMSAPTDELVAPFREGWIAGGSGVSQVYAICADHPPAH